MRELECEESWVLKNWCFLTVVLEKTPESPLDFKEIQPVNPQENQPLIFIGGTDAKAETPIVWPPHEKNWFIGKVPNVGQDWRQEEKGMTDDETLDGISNSMDMSLSVLRESVMDREPWHDAAQGVSKSQTGLSDWTELNWFVRCKLLGLAHTQEPGLH